MLPLVKTPLYFIVLITVVAVYASFGSPTPDTPGVVEILVALGLMGCVGFQGFLTAINPHSFSTPFLKSLQMLFLCGLIVPTLSALFHDNALGFVVRDLAAFMFIALPLFLSVRLSTNPNLQKYFFASLVLTGVMLSIRTLLPILNIWIPQGELLYLSNSPIVLMTAIFLILTLWKNVAVLSFKLWVSSCVMLCGILIVLGAMMLDVQRATIGAVIISLLIFMTLNFFKSPHKTIVPFFVFLGLILFFYPTITEILDVMAMKTAQVGMNSRIAEATAVFDVVKSNMGSFLFGLGWGATFPSPAVAGLDVNYTHSFLTTMFLKGGLILFICAVWAVMCALYEIFWLYRQDNIKGLISFWSLTIPVFLYASHKSLDFGLVLLLIGMWSLKNPIIAKSPPIS